MGKKKKKWIQESPVTNNLKGIVWTAIFLSLLVPLIYSLKSVFPFVAPRAFFFMAMVQIMFFTWIVLAIKNKRYRPKMSPVTVSFAAFLIAMTLSTVFGADPFHSFWSNYERMSGLLIHIYLFAFFLVLASVIKTEKHRMTIIGLMAPIASIVALISIAHNFGVIELANHFQNGSTLANTSFMGSYLLVVVFFCLYGMIKSDNLWKKYYLINFIIISSGIMLNSGGRAMKGAFLAGMLLLGLLYLAFNERKSILNYVSRFFLLLGIGASVFIGISAFNEGSLVREKISGLHGMSARFLVWDMAWEGFKENPILGLGPDNFRLAFEKEFDPALRVMDGGEIWFDRAHNGVFDLLVTVGGLGTILFFVMFMTALFVFWREYLKEKRIDIWAPAIFTSLFAAYFIQNLTVFDMISSYMLLFVMLSFAASLAPEREITDDFESSRPVTIPLIIASLMLLITGSYFIISPYRANLNASIVIKDPIFYPRIEYYEKAFKGPIGRNATTFSFAEKLIINDQKVGLEKEEKEIVIERMKFMIERIEELIEGEPKLFKEHWIAGRMYNEYYNYHLLQEIMHGDPAQKSELIEEAKEVNLRARELITKAIEISPRNQQGYWDMAQVEVNAGNIHIFLGEIELATKKFEEAFLLTEKAVELEPRNLEAQIKMLMVADEVVMDSDLVRKKALEALEINPSWELELEKYL